MDFQLKNIVVNDQLLSYYEHSNPASKQALVFLHGWRADSKIWIPAMKNLSPELASVYLIDLPGFGGSEEPRHPFTVSDYAEIILSFFEKLHIKNTVLVGHSIGGRIAIKLGTKSTFKKIVLVDSAGIKINAQKIRMLNTLAKLASPIFRLPGLEKARAAIYKQLGSDDYLATPNLTHTYKNIISEDLRPILKHILSPTAIIWGENDTETPLQMGKIINQEIPHSSLTIIKDAGHFPFLDQPDQFISALLKALF